MGNYTIPEHPIYDEQIRKLENDNPTNAENAINGLGTAATKNIGNGANDVAAGNHNHDSAYAAKSHSTDMIFYTSKTEPRVMNIIVSSTQ